MIELIEEEDAHGYENIECDERIYKKYEEFATECRIQRKINYGDYNHLFNKIQAYDRNKDIDFDVCFFYACIDIFKKGNLVKSLDEKSFSKIKSVNASTSNFIFYNSEGFYRIDENKNEHGVKRQDSNDVHYRYCFTNEHLTVYNDIHFITVFKIISQVYKDKYSKIISQKFFNITTLLYYLSMIDLIIVKPKMCDEILKEYNIEIDIKVDFNLFLIDLEKNKL